MKKFYNALKKGFPITLVTFLLIIIGLGLSIIANIDPNKDNVKNIWFAEHLIKWSKNLYGLFLSSGIVSVIVEVSSIKTVVEKGMMNLIEGDFPMKNFSKETIKKFHLLSAKYITEKPNKFPKDIKKSVYSIEDKLIDLLNGPYYEEHKLNYIVDNYNDNYFKKVVIRKFTLINGKREDLNFKLWMGYKSENLNEDIIRNNVKISKLKINNSDYSKSTDDIIHIIKSSDESNEYQYEVSFNVSEKISPFVSTERINIECEVEYLSSKIDKSYGFKLAYPCAKLDHNIRIKGKWIIEATSFFSFDNFKNDSKISEVERIVQDNVAIKYNDWALPGDGYIVYFKENG